MGSNTMDRSENEYDEQVKDGFETVLKREIPDKSQKELKERIDKFLTKNPVGSLATCADNMPRSTPVRFSANDLNIYILTEGGGKLDNIRKNPNVCFSVYGRYSGFQSCKGTQIWGKADIIEPDDKEKYAQAHNVFRLAERDDLKKIDMKNAPTNMPIIRIEPNRVRYLSIPEGILNAELKLD